MEKCRLRNAMRCDPIRELFEVQQNANKADSDVKERPAHSGSHPEKPKKES